MKVEDSRRRGALDQVEGAPRCVVAGLKDEVARLEHYLGCALGDGVKLWRGKVEKGEKLAKGEGGKASAADLKGMKTD